MQRNNESNESINGRHHITGLATLLSVHNLIALNNR